MRISGDGTRRGIFPGAAIIIFALAGICLFRYFRYWINPDATSYISIAHKYLRGDVPHAINGHWGPLLSWLLMPFLSVNVPAALAAKVLSLCIGAGAIASIYHLSRRFEIADSLRLLSVLCLLPALLFYSLFDFTPDLLLPSFLALYLSFLLDPAYIQSARHGIACGVLAALAYLSKAIALPFFVLHFALCNAFLLFGSDPHKRRLILRSCLLGYAAFCLISGVWIALLSNKYGQLTFGTAGEYNYRRFGLAERDQPPIKQRFLIPPNETATHAWEDPASIPLKPWNPLQSTQGFKQQVAMIRGAFSASLSAYHWFSIFSLTVIAVVIAALCMQSREAIIAQRTSLFSMLAIGIYNCGFLPLGIVQERYLFINVILIVLLGAQLLTKVHQSAHGSRTLKTAIMTLFFVSFAVMPGQALKRHANSGKSAYLVSVQLTGNHDFHGNIASNTNYFDALQIAFRTENQYYGIVSDTLSESQILDTLRTYNITYYFAWNTPGRDFNLRGYEELRLKEAPDLRIYALQRPNAQSP